MLKFSFELTCSDICLQMNGSVWINREQVFLFSSFGRVARVVRRWFRILASLVYLWLGLSHVRLDPVLMLLFIVKFLCGIDDDDWYGKISAEFWTFDIHSATSSVIPQPLESPIVFYEKYYRKGFKKNFYLKKLPALNLCTICI